MSSSRVRQKKRIETIRLKRLRHIEEEVRQQGFQQIAGIDEAGRGPLAGPIVAAACILPEEFTLRGINDSKKLNEKQRLAFYQEIVLHPEIDYGVGVIESAEIDRLNIHQATLEAMRRAVFRLKKRPTFLLIDGVHTPMIDIPSEAVVDGDQKVQAIAAASIIAKVTRDNIMIGYHYLYQEYGFKDHKGYGTDKHRKAIDQFGLTPIHRRSFIKGENHGKKYDCLQSNCK